MSHPHPNKREAKFPMAVQLQQGPQVMDEVWVLGEAWPSGEMFRRSFAVVGSLLSSIGLDSHKTPGY